MHCFFKSYFWDKPLFATHELGILGFVATLIFLILPPVPSSHWMRLFTREKLWFDIRSHVLFTSVKIVAEFSDALDCSTTQPKFPVKDISQYIRNTLKGQRSKGFLRHLNALVTRVWVLWFFVGKSYLVILVPIVKKTVNIVIGTHKTWTLVWYKHLYYNNMPNIGMVRLIMMDSESADSQSVISLNSRS